MTFSSSALKKLSFPTSSLALNQRRDHVTAQLKTGDKRYNGHSLLDGTCIGRTCQHSFYCVIRSSSGPYHPSNAKISNTGNSMKTNDVAVMIRSNDNKEMKPVLPNQGLVFNIRYYSYGNFNNEHCCPKTVIFMIEKCTVLINTLLQAYNLFHEPLNDLYLFEIK